MTNAPESQRRSRLLLVLQIVAVPLIIGTGVLAGRLIWEQTVWTWQRGPQMVGFSLAHGPFVFLFLFPLLLMVWLGIVSASLFWRLFKSRPIPTMMWATFSAAGVCLVLTMLPDSLWQRVFIGRMAASPHVGDLFVGAAYRGDLGEIRDMVAHGVSVDAIDTHDWKTALHASAVTGDSKLLRYLVSKGANINALDRDGDSPLSLAESRGNKAAAEYLIGIGAKRIEGSQAQHEKAIEDEVRESRE